MGRSIDDVIWVRRKRQFFHFQSMRVREYAMMCFGLDMGSQPFVRESVVCNLKIYMFVEVEVPT